MSAPSVTVPPDIQSKIDSNVVPITRLYEQDLDEIPINERLAANINDHNECKVCELYVTPKYGSFKKETQHYAHGFTMKLYVDTIHYDIAAGEPLSFQHFLSTFEIDS